VWQHLPAFLVLSHSVAAATTLCGWLCCRGEDTGVRTPRLWVSWVR
jgi:hypothetical protein